EGAGPAALQAGAQDYVPKGPVDADLLGRALRHALERKRTSDTLLRLEKAVGTMQLGVTITDVPGRILYTNAAEAAMHGHDDEEVGATIDEWFQRIHPEDRERVQRRIEEHLQGRSPRFEDEHRMRHKDGTYRWVLSRGFASRSYHGRPYRMAGGQTDV